ncbi:MAG: hypothetical protein U0354_05095 [Candidatus Sericytochromatia bacterium]
MKNFIYTILIFSLFILSIGRDYYEISLSSGVDLRNRIVGARLLNDNKDPYLYKWKKGDSEKLVDINDNNINKVNKVTIPPSLLFIIKKVSLFEYGYIRIAWFIFTYLMLLFIILSFYFISTNLQKINILIIGVIFITTVPAWYLHIERGQNYIIYIFLMTVSFIFTKFNYLKTSSFFIALNCWIRPNTLSFIIGNYIHEINNFKLLNILKDKKNTYFIYYLLLFILISLTYISPSIWKSYSISNKAWAEYHLNNDNLIKVTNFNMTDYPQNIENKHSSYYLVMSLEISNENLSIQKMLFRVFNFKLGIFEMILLYLIFLFMLIKILNKSDTSLENKYLSGFLCYILSEYFLPVPRYHYNSVQWIFPILIMFSNPIKDNISNFLLCLSFVLVLPISEKIPYNLSLAELILFITVIYYIKHKDKDYIS